MKNKSMINNKTNNSKLGCMFIGGLIAVTGISGCVLRSNIVSAEGDSVTDTVSITVPVSCTMSGNIDAAHTATINNGIYSGATGSEYENGIGKTTLTTFCNDQNGFSIYAIGYTGDEAGNTNLAGTAASGNANIATGTATSGSTSNWAMKVNKVDNPVSGDPVTYNPENMTIQTDTEGPFSSYHTVPDTYTKVAEYHALTGSSSTDIGTNALGAKITTTYAAYISPTQPADTYTGQVKYVMVHPYDHAAPSDITPPTSCTTPVEGVTYMQELATMNSTQKTAVLTSMTEDAQYYLADQRDNKSYCVAKLKDGNIWMTQNLDHDIVTDGSVTYDNTTTDLGYNTSTGTYDTASWTPERATTTSAADWIGSTTDPYSYNPGDVYWNGVEDPGYSDWDAYYYSCTWDNVTQKRINCNESLNPYSTYVSSTGDSHYHLGNYYNFTAAIAMNDSSTHITQNELIEQSICPAGWTLPRVGTGDDTFYSLWNEYGFTSGGRSYNDANGNNKHDEGEDALWTAPLYSPASGSYEGMLGYVGGDGRFWSPVVDADDYAREGYFDVIGVVFPSSVVGRDYGSPLRCVARPVTSSVSGL